MTTTATLISADSAPPPDTSSVPAFVFPSELGTGAPPRLVSPGQDVHSLFGSSAGAEDVSWFLRTAKQPCVVGICAGIAGSKSAVTHTGAGPTVTASFTGSLTGPLLDAKIGVKVTASGVLGVGQIGYYLDGSGDFGQYAAVLPSEAAAVVTGLVDITNGAVLESYVANSLVGNHFDFTLPTAEVLTFPAGSLTGSLTGLKAATASVAAPVTYTAADLLAPGLALMASNPRKVTIKTTGGTPADAPASCTITGTRYGVVLSEVLAIGQVLNDVVSSVNAYDTITSIALLTGQGVGALLTFGYSAAYANAAEIADAANVLAVGAGLTGAFSIAETARGQFLSFSTTAVGVAAQVEIDDATSTGDTPLGFTSADDNLTATGAAATLPIPYLGITLTFAAGTYPLGDTYTMTATGPTASIAAITATETAIRNSGLAFGYVLPLVVPATADNARSLCDAQDALVSTWDTDANQPVFPIQITPGPFHVASATPATNAAAITANDTALLAAMSGQTSIGTVVPDDGYRTGTRLLGRYRRPAALGLAYMLSRFLLSDDPGAATHGSIPEWSLTAPDGVTLARDQANPTTAIQLGGSQGPGFTVLQNVNGLPRVKRGVTRAGVSSRLVDLGPGLRMGRRGQAVLYNTAKTQVENENFPTNASGQIIDGVRNALVGTFTDPLDAALRTPPLALNASSVTVTIDAAEVIANTRNITVTAVLQKLGSAENVTITAIVAGVVQSTTITG